MWATEEGDVDKRMQWVWRGLDLIHALEVEFMGFADGLVAEDGGK